MVSLPDLGISVMVDAPVRPGLQSARLKHHTSPLKPSCCCCLQKINLNVFLSICKSMRLCPVIIIYFCLRSLKNKTWSYSGPYGLQSHSETTHASKLVVFFLPRSFKGWSQALAITSGLLSLTLVFLFHFLKFFSFLLSSIYFYFICTCYFFTYKAKLSILK